MSRFPPEITIISGINTGAPMTFSSPNSAEPYLPSSSWPSNGASSTSVAGLSDSQSSLNDVAAAFFSNKGAVAGIFTGLGILLISLIAVIYIGWIHRRRKRATHHRNVDVLDFKTHHDPPYPYSGSEPPNISSLKSSEGSHRISFASVVEWWTRRRGGRRSSRSRHVFNTSHSPSLAGADVKDVGEEDTQWTLGKVLEDQQQKVVTRPLPASRPRERTQSPRVASVFTDNRSEGRRFTLEDALLPSLSSPVPYNVGSGTGNRHPYAQM